MRFRRRDRAATDEAPPPEGPGDGPDEREEASGATTGPFDIDDVDVENDGVDRLDVGALLLATPGPDRQVQMRVDQRTESVQGVMIAGTEGAVEVCAFAAPVGESLWEEMRAELVAETERAGGSATERPGRWGPELVCQTPVRLPDGKTASQPSRVVGVDGPRWLLRATFFGRPAVEPEDSTDWEDLVAALVVRRGPEAMPVGDPLPFVLPPHTHPA